MRASERVGSCELGGSSTTPQLPTSPTPQLCITVRWFALLREARGREEETVETGAATSGALYEELRARHRLPLARDALRLAVNGAFAAWDAPLHDGDAVAFLAPFAGG